jgi:hypothetical protein
MFNTLSKALLSLTYLVALASLFFVLPMDANPVVQKLALALVAIHVVECLLAFKYVKTYAGPLWLSIVLALLFGVLHWMPLARAARQASADQASA